MGNDSEIDPGFQEACNDLGGEIEKLETTNSTVCKLEDRGVSIQENGETVPIKQ